MNNLVIAELKLIAEKHEEVVECAVCVCALEFDEPGVWISRAHLPDLYEQFYDVQGEDSMQSLVLCLKLVGSLLKTVECVA